MIYVEVYYVENKKQLQGEITWDGKKLTPSDDSEALQIVLGRPLYVPNEAQTKVIKIDPKKNPEKFIKNLYLQYRGYMLNVSSAMEK